MNNKRKMKKKEKEFKKVSFHQGWLSGPFSC
jgi:hypothetical protein